MAGWVRLHRKSMKSRVWANDGLWKTWCWCLMRANHNQQIVAVQTGRGMTEVSVLRGQFIYGRKAAAKALRCPESTCHERMKKLAKLQNITLEPSTHYTLVTICNFETYNRQPTGNLAGNPTTNQQPTNNQPDTDKNVSKESKKNQREKKAASPLPPLPEELRSLSDLWVSWVEHRREKGTKLTARAAELQISDMQKMGTERAAAALRHSIKNNYTGLYEPKENGSHSTTRPKLGSVINPHGLLGKGVHNDRR